jgi:uncharacterized NAD(P)/FAD-binding protein YdhS
LAIMENSWKVLIVGGGASGIFSAIALERFGIDASQIDIAEPRELLGEGLAYQTRDLHHRLNVPTGRMSSLEEFPDDFVEWSNAASYSFMQRRTYSGYLRERLGQGHNHIRACVTDLESESDGVVRANFDTGETNDYVAVVLAMGHGKALIPDFLRGVPESSRIIKDVWDGISLPESQTIICFGTGLSFVDIALTHLSRDTRNKVIAISGSGNLPERHVQFQITPFTPTVKEVATLAKLRTYFLDAGDKWREAVDGLRPIMDTVWRGFTIAPDVADQVYAEIALGRITVVKGRVAGVEVKDEQVTISLGDGSSYSGDYLAITIGRDYELSDPLTLNLLKAGKTSRGPLGMGLSVDVATGLLQRTDGTPYLQIFAIGPLRSGQAFETTAIPEIRKQATAIAERIVVNSYGLKV